MKTFAFVGVNSKGRVKPGIGSSKKKKSRFLTVTKHFLLRPNCV